MSTLDSINGNLYSKDQNDKIYSQILQMPKPAYFVLIDPDKTGVKESLSLAVLAEQKGVDGLLIGSSLLLHDNLDNCLREMKKLVKIPIIIFPGLLNTYSPLADAILFLNMISSRNAQLLIGEQVRAAPLLKKLGLESISTAYILIESGKLTSVQYVSNSLPIPRDKPDILIAHVLAAEYIGMKMIYLETGSGANQPVPLEMIKQVKLTTDLPIIVGGGIRKADTASEIAAVGADIIVTGTVMEDEENHQLLADFVEAIHRWRK
ncbi:MAG: geranylgeranylglyceryl/heptaprenylglyceryl phosphate synthase [Candidatus Cloacimonetes bacterium]|nr:geranylgeranylglyceryl/heptaprenylglyceryl phosphate synthase [Candidatus Cloacimonadota bacterium]